MRCSQAECLSTSGVSGTNVIFSVWQLSTTSVSTRSFPSISLMSFSVIAVCYSLVDVVIFSLFSVVLLSVVHLFSDIFHCHIQNIHGHTAGLPQLIALLQLEVHICWY